MEIRSLKGEVLRTMDVAWTTVRKSKIQQALAVTDSIVSAAVLTDVPAGRDIKDISAGIGRIAVKKKTARICRMRLPLT